jgi:hypothetical protein
MGPTDHPETSVTNYHYLLRNDPEESRPQRLIELFNNTVSYLILSRKKNSVHGRMMSLPGVRTCVCLTHLLSGVAPINRFLLLFSRWGWGCGVFNHLFYSSIKILLAWRTRNIFDLKDLFTPLTL